MYLFDYGPTHRISPSSCLSGRTPPAAGSRSGRRVISLSKPTRYPSNSKELSISTWLEPTRLAYDRYYRSLESSFFTVLNYFTHALTVESLAVVVHSSVRTRGASRLGLLEYPATLLASLRWRSWTPSLTLTQIPHAGPSISDAIYHTCVTEALSVTFWLIWASRRRSCFSVTTSLCQPLWHLW